MLVNIIHFCNPVFAAGNATNINRNTVKNIKACSYISVHVDERSGDILKLLGARNKALVYFSSQFTDKT
jgi:hypothetical protein